MNITPCGTLRSNFPSTTTPCGSPLSLSVVASGSPTNVLVCFCVCWAGHISVPGGVPAYPSEMARGDKSGKSKLKEKPKPKAKAKTKLGRPPASSSAETRGRIIDVARRSFAELGYEATTNRSLATEAGITTGAIYHYFESKLDIFIAVENEVQRRVYLRFGAAERSADTFIGKLEAVLETAHELNREDATLAQFLGASRIDRMRVPELAAAHTEMSAQRVDFFDDMVAFGVSTGEIDPADQATVSAMIHTMTVGLTDAVSNNLVAHRNAIDGFKALLEGKLLHRPK